MSEEELKDLKQHLENEIKHYSALAFNNRKVEYYYQKVREARRKLNEVNEVIARSYS